MKILIKRIYEDVAEQDGLRVLVDRLWPRGVKKEDAALDEWAKALAPSTQARKEFNHDPAKFDEFERIYLAELRESEEAQTEAEKLKKLTEQENPQTLTLLYAAKDEHCNHAMILKDYLTQLWG